MTTTLILDLSRTLLFPKDQNYLGGLNDLNDELSQKGKYNFLEHFEFNEELFKYLETIKSNYDLHVLTNKTIQNEPAVKSRLDKVFKQVFSAQLDLKLDKKDPECYKQLLETISKKADEALYIDDNEANIVAAQAAGLTTITYDTNDALLNVLKISGIG